MPIPVFVTAYKDRSFDFVRRLFGEGNSRRLLLSCSFPHTNMCAVAASLSLCDEFMLAFCYAGTAQVIKTPPTSYFIKKAAGVDLGSHEPGHQKRGSITLKHVYEIAKARNSPLFASSYVTKRHTSYWSCHAQAS